MTQNTKIIKKSLYRVTETEKQWLQSESLWIQAAMKAALAAALAWEIASYLAPSNLASAALAAFFTVQITAIGTLRQAAYRLLGIVLGVGVAFSLDSVRSFGGLGIGIVILISLALGRALRLGPAGSLQIPVNALIVLGASHLSQGVSFVSAIDAGIGVTIGVIISVFLLPSFTLDPVRQSLNNWAKSLGELSSNIAQHFDDPTQQHTTILLELARESYTTYGEKAVDALDKAHESARLHPHRFTNRYRNQSLQLTYLDATFSAISHASLQLRGVARALDDVKPHHLVDVELLDSLFIEIAKSFEIVSNIILTGPEHYELALVQTLNRANDHLRDFLNRTPVATQPDGALYPDVLSDEPTLSNPVLLYGSILADASRILDELDPRKGPHAEAFSSHLRIGIT
jgi:uncharacterized membrane protein YgaE (UPF0421/DUF939 family)